ncbi:hypothetical protein FRB95_006168 [Tulasnella sp. JGI-2019a]|nr:hypothetical protein FRB95_006168 [Tulasnella sp. JGI-2019a]
MGRHLSAKRQRCNSRLPIFRLPNELLVEIFHLILVADGSYFDDLLSLAMICKDWSIIVSETPPLWAFVHSEQPRSIYSTALAKSKRLPLRIEFQDLQSEDEISYFLNSIYEEVHRWQVVELEFRNPYSFQTLKRIESSSALSLEDLVVDCHDCNIDIDIRSITLLQGGTKRLRRLSLYRVPILWTSSLLFQLRYLTIVGYNVRGPSEAEAATILRGCPDLVELNFHYTEFVWKIQPTPMAPIDLPSLVKLNLYVPPHIMEAILALIRIPACRKLVITGQARFSTIFPKAIHHLAPILHSIVRSAPAISIKSLNSYVMVQANDDTTTFLRLNFQADWLMDILEWSLGDPHLGPSLPAISFSAEHFQGDLITVLEKLPSVTGLNLGEGGDEVVKFLTKLLMKDGSHRWPCLPYSCYHSSTATLSAHISSYGWSRIDAERGVRGKSVCCRAS